MTYINLIEEYKTLRNRLSQLSGSEHEAAMKRLIEIDTALKDFERNMPRYTGGSSNYKPLIPASEPSIYTRKEVVAWAGIGFYLGVFSAALITIILK